MRTSPTDTQDAESGFALAEFLVSSSILLVASAFIFAILVDAQHHAGYQTEIHSVMENARIAFDTVEPILRQAGNDPLQIGIQGIDLIRINEARIRSDLTGSAGPSFPDKGDPDGDVEDTGEDVTLRYDSVARSLSLTPRGGPAQMVSTHISDFKLECFDSQGLPTSDGSGARRVRVSISAASSFPNPQTRKRFHTQIKGDILLASMNQLR